MINALSNLFVIVNITLSRVALKSITLKFMSLAKKWLFIKIR